MIGRLPRRPRQIHRLLVPLAAVPLGITAGSGALYGTLLWFNIDVPWLLRWHTGNFGVVNLQPVYAPLLGGMTLVLVGSGVALWRSGKTGACSSGDST
jgi:hypothetical protein